MAFVHEKKSVLNVNWITFFYASVFRICPPAPKHHIHPVTYCKSYYIKGPCFYIFSLCGCLFCILD